MISEKMMKNIVIVNAHWNNRGDEAAIRALLTGITDKCHTDNVNITILIKDDNPIQQFPILNNVQYRLGKFNAKIWDIWISVLTRGIIGFNKKLKETILEIKKSDYIIYSPGGSVINKRFYWRKQMEYLVPFMCSKFYKIPMVIAAPSIGPFDLAKSNRLIKWLLKTPEVLCVREDISKEYLKEINIDENVEVTIDSAFYDKIDIESNHQKLLNDNELKSFLDSYEKVIGITISDFTWHVKLNKNENLAGNISVAFKKLIKKLSDENYGILFIPQLFGNQNDSNYMNTFSGNNTYLMSDEYDCTFQQFIISKLYAVIGTRYHSNIFAAKMGTPFLSIIYEEKMEGFIKKANLMEYSIELSDLSFELIEEKFRELIMNYFAVKKVLIDKNSEWQKMAERTMNLVAEAYRQTKGGKRGL